MILSDEVCEVSTKMMAVMIITMLIGIIPITYMLIDSYDYSVSLNDQDSDVISLSIVLFFLLVMMAGIVMMIRVMRINIKADHTAIRARIYPFMKSYRVIPLSEILALEVTPIGGLLKYGGIGLKKSLGGLTSYTMTGQGYVLRIKLNNKKSLHVQINQYENWRRYVHSFKESKV